MKTCCAVLFWMLLSTAVARCEDSEPAVMEAVCPVYPGLAVQARIEGVVRIEIGLDATGRVTTASVVDGHPLLKSASLDAARRWRFSAASNPSVVTLRFAFRLLPEGTPELEAGSRFSPPYTAEVRRVTVPPTVNYDPAPDPPRRKR